MTSFLAWGQVFYIDDFITDGASRGEGIRGGAVGLGVCKGEGGSAYSGDTDDGNKNVEKILKPLSVFLLSILLSCASNKKSLSEENLVDMKELSGLKVGMDKDEAMGALSTDPIDSLTPEVNGIKYQSYYYLCKTGVRTHHSAGAYSPGQDSYPVVHYWMTFQDGKLICKGPIQKYLIHDTEAIRKIGAAIESEKGKMDGRAIYLR